MNFLKLFIPFFQSYLLNYFFAYCPCWELRKLYFKLLGMKIGKKTLLDMATYVLAPSHIIIGIYCHINRKCFLDARGKISIGNNVSISHNVTLCSAGHDFNSPNFAYEVSPIVIHDNVWIGVNVTILKGVIIGEGAVIAAGAIVTKDVESYSVYAGIPAKKIGVREENIQYKCTQFAYYKNIRKPYFK